PRAPSSTLFPYTTLFRSDYVSAVRKGSLFPAGALDYSGPGLTSPGESVEVWVKLDPGQYILICWNDGHARSTPPRPITVEYAISDRKSTRLNSSHVAISY